MHVKTIADCRILQESILQHFQPSLSYPLSLRPLFYLLLRGPLKTGFAVYWLYFRAAREAQNFSQGDPDSLGLNILHQGKPCKFTHFVLPQKKSSVTMFTHFVLTQKKILLLCLPILSCLRKKLCYYVYPFFLPQKKALLLC